MIYILSNRNTAKALETKEIEPVLMSNQVPEP